MMGSFFRDLLPFCLSIICFLHDKQVLTFAPPALAFQGDCRRSLDEIRGFCASYDARLHLLNNNCYSFSDRLLQFLLRDDDR